MLAITMTYRKQQQNYCLAETEMEWWISSEVNGWLWECNGPNVESPALAFTMRPLNADSDILCLSWLICKKEMQITQSPQNHCKR